MKVQKCGLCGGRATRHVTARRGQETVGFACSQCVGGMVRTYNLTHRTEFSGKAVSNGIGAGRRPGRS